MGRVKLGKYTNERGIEVMYVANCIPRWFYYVCLFLYRVFSPKSYTLSVLHFYKQEPFLEFEFAKYTTPDRIYFCKKENRFICEWNYERYQYFKSIGKEHKIPKFLR